jgi:hypothetical protein
LLPDIVPGGTAIFTGHLIPFGKHRIPQLLQLLYLGIDPTAKQA